MSKLDFFESFLSTQKDPNQDIGTSSKLFLHDSWYQESIFFTLDETGWRSGISVLTKNFLDQLRR